MSSSTIPQPTSSSVSEPRVPRLRVYAGFVMDKNAICRWAHILSQTNRVYHPDNQDDTTAAWVHLMDHVEHQGGYFSAIGEIYDEIKWMVVTRAARFNGYQGMPESLLPAYKEEDVEKMWRERLTKDGLHPHEYVFKTVLA
ncbi:hypothetical protein Hypma_014854 [Hypsizygus marmoreus]|uniref:Uncharacterized protein n=1 Tax=Hypsizygus marmoreus TaxID=39966 RepID=A0A369K619_HYPMA|nr:hypothetical protein Hypma_014854 [Hypsizygus marmoreus]